MGKKKRVVGDDASAAMQASLGAFATDLDHKSVDSDADDGVINAIEEAMCLS
jgi:hypothetical protein